MLILGQSYPATWHGKPEGMTREDWPTWLTWLLTGRFLDDSYYYNVRIGEGLPTPPGTPANYARAWELSSAFRIDALGITNNIVRLYEVKRIASPVDVWQVESYGAILRLELTVSLILESWLIAERLTPGTREQAAQLSIRVWTPEEA